MWQLRVREDGIGTGAVEQQGPGDGAGTVPREQDLLHAGGGEPGCPAGGNGRLERVDALQAGAVRLGDLDAGAGGELEGAGRRTVPRQVGHQVEGVMGVLPAARGKEPDRGGQIAGSPSEMITLNALRVLQAAGRLT